MSLDGFLHDRNHSSKRAFVRIGIKSTNRLIFTTRTKPSLFKSPTTLSHQALYTRRRFHQQNPVASPTQSRRCISDGYPLPSFASQHLPSPHVTFCTALAGIDQPALAGYRLQTAEGGSGGNSAVCRRRQRTMSEADRPRHKLCRVAALTTKCCYPTPPL